MSKQSNMRLRKIIFKNTFELICVGHLVLGINPTFKYETFINTYKHSEAPLEQNNFSFASSC